MPFILSFCSFLSCIHNATIQRGILAMIILFPAPFSSHDRLEKIIYILTIAMAPPKDILLDRPFIAFSPSLSLFHTYTPTLQTTYPNTISTTT